MGSKLPAMTMDLLAFGKFLRHYIVWILLAMVGTAFGAYRFSVTDKGRDVIDGVRIGLPVFGKIWLKYQVALFGAHALDTADRRIAAGASLEPRPARSARGASQSGDDIDHHGARRQEPGRCADPDQIFPDLAAEISRWASRRRAAADAQLVSNFLRRIGDGPCRSLALIEPAILIVMGVVVVFILISLYLPIFSLDRRRRSVNHGCSHTFASHCDNRSPLPGSKEERAQAELLATRYHASSWT